MHGRLPCSAWDAPTLATGARSDNPRVRSRPASWSNTPRAPARRPITTLAKGAVVAYVLEEAIRSKVNDGPERVYRVGESGLEPPGAAHSVSACEPARLLAVFVAEDGAELTTFDK